MASLKANLRVTKNNFAKNLTVCWAQAREDQRVSAIEAAKYRNTDEKLANLHFKKFDEATATVKWIEEIKKVVQLCPELAEEVKLPTEPPIKIE